MLGEKHRLWGLWTGLGELGNGEGLRGTPASALRTALLLPWRLQPLGPSSLQTFFLKTFKEREENSVFCVFLFLKIKLRLKRSP